MEHSIPMAASLSHASSGCTEMSVVTLNWVFIAILSDLEMLLPLSCLGCLAFGVWFCLSPETVRLSCWPLWISANFHFLITDEQVNKTEVVRTTVKVFSLWHCALIVLGKRALCEPLMAYDSASLSALSFNLFTYFLNDGYFPPLAPNASLAMTMRAAATVLRCTATTSTASM